MNQPNPSRTPSSMPLDDPTIPPTLHAAIHRLESTTPSPDFSDLDHAVLAAAHTRLRRRSPLTLALRAGAGLAAAAAIALVISLLPRPGGGGAEALRGGGGPTSALASDTLNPAANITILDAFHLARLIQNPSTRPADPARWSTWDVTGDGVVDQRDVDALAQRAVKISSAPTTKGGGA